MAKKSKKQIQARVKELRRHDDLYNRGIPEIDDPAFDAMVEELRAWDPKNPYLSELRSEDLKGDVVTHKVPMLSTQKAYGAKPLADWVKRIMKAAKEVGIKKPIVITNGYFCEGIVYYFVGLG